MTVDWFDRCVSCEEAWCCGRCACCPPAQHRSRVRLLRVAALLRKHSITTFSGVSGPGGTVAS